MNLSTMEGGRTSNKGGLDIKTKPGKVGEEEVKVVKIDFNTWYRSLSFDNVSKLDENGNGSSISQHDSSGSDSDATITWEEEEDIQGEKLDDDLDALLQFEGYDGSSEDR